MSHLIHIEIDDLDGTLLRVLGLIERRGFFIDAIEMYQIDDKTRGLSVTARAKESHRRIETLLAQIDRLYGLKRVAEPRKAAAAQKLSA